jgi:hypothetical protein
VKMIWHKAIRVDVTKRANIFFKPGKKIAIVFVSEKDQVFVIATVVNMVISVGVNFHSLNILQNSRSF